MIRVQGEKHGQQQQQPTLGLDIFLSYSSLFYTTPPPPAKQECCPCLDEPSLPHTSPISSLFLIMVSVALMISRKYNREFQNLMTTSSACLHFYTLLQNPETAPFSYNFYLQYTSIKGKVSFKKVQSYHHWFGIFKGKYFYNCNI